MLILTHVPTDETCDRDDAIETRNLAAAEIADHYQEALEE